MKRVRFSLDAPKAKAVLLVGDFTDWEARAKRMRRPRRGSPSFVTVVELEPGTYEYKFIVDGHWVEDPRAEAVPNSFGTRNSVVSV